MRTIIGVILLSAIVLHTAKLAERPKPIGTFSPSPHVTSSGRSANLSVEPFVEVARGQHIRAYHRGPVVIEGDPIQFVVVWDLGAMGGPINPVDDVFADHNGDSRSDLLDWADYQNKYSWEVP